VRPLKPGAGVVESLELIGSGPVVLVHLWRQFGLGGRIERSEFYEPKFCPIIRWWHAAGLRFRWCGRSTTRARLPKPARAADITVPKHL